MSRSWLMVWAVLGSAFAFASSAPGAAPGGNGEIAYQGEPVGEAPQIFAMAANGTGKHMLTHPAHVDNRLPKWSFDGKQIAWEVTDSTNTSEIWRMNADGSAQTQLTTGPTDNEFSSWTPDGRILFSSNRYATPTSAEQLYVMNADGSGAKRLTTEGAPDVQPAASPDGRTIAFVSGRDGHPEIYVMNADGSNQRRLTYTGTYDLNWDPNFSPDGSRIVFTSARGSGAPQEVWIMNADGSGQRQLTTGSEGGSINSASDEPVWSPDGKQIAFFSNRSSGGIDQIYVMNSDGSGQTNISNEDQIDLSPAWQPLASPTQTRGRRPPRAQCVVPQLAGYRLSAARRVLKHAHCRLGNVTRRRQRRHPRGRVIAQHPQPGRHLPARSRVAITIA